MRSTAKAFWSEVYVIRLGVHLEVTAFQVNVTAEPAVVFVPAVAILPAAVHVSTPVMAIVIV